MLDEIKLIKGTEDEFFLNLIDDCIFKLYLIRKKLRSEQDAEL